MAECGNRRPTHRHGVVCEPATQHFGQPLALRLNAVVPGRPELLLDLLQLRPRPFSNRCPPQQEAGAAPPGRAVVHEPEEVERLRLAESMRAAMCKCIPAELDEPRLVGMETEPKLG